MAAGIDHIIINVKDYERSRRFYDWLLPQLGYTAGSDDADGIRRWYTAAEGSSESFELKKAAPQFHAATFHKDRVGLCEIAFRGESRAQIDELTKELEAHGAQILAPPREYNYVPGYYAIFFTDPDGLKLEVVHLP